MAPTVRELSITQEVIRIISARPATPKERRRYEDEIRSLYPGYRAASDRRAAANLKRLADRPHDEIDTTEIPEMADAQWSAATFIGPSSGRTQLA